MLDSLDQVDWDSLEHAYGPASHVPDVLRAFAFGSEAERRQMLEENWWGAIIHQGTYYSATEAVVPFLVEIALAPAAPGRREAVYELAEIVGGYAERESRHQQPVLFESFLPKRSLVHDDVQFIEGAYQAAVDQISALRESFLDEREDKESTLAMTLLFATFIKPWRTALSTLLDALDSESRPEVRAATILAASDLLMLLADSEPDAWRQAADSVAPRLAQILHDGPTDEEVAAAAFALLETGVEANRQSALACVNRLAFEEDFEFSDFPGRRRGYRLLWDFYEALWTSPDDQVAMIRRGLRSNNPNQFQESLQLVERHCRTYRDGPSIFVPEIESLLEDDSYSQQHDRIAGYLTQLGNDGLELARERGLQNTKIKDQVDSFQQSLEMFDREAPASDEATRREVERLAQLTADALDDLRDLDACLADQNPRIRVAAIAAFHRITGDSAKTVDLILENWMPDFIAVPLLKLLGECGPAAAKLEPELRRFVESPKRYVDSGWISGICLLDDRMVAAASNALGKIS